MTAGISFNAVTGVLEINGTSLDDAGSIHVLDINNTKFVHATMVTYNADRSIKAIRSEDYELAKVKLIRFSGFKGGDLFANYSSVPCEAYGGPGDDALVGGNGNDTLKGGEGLDRLEGKNGNDSLVGGNGLDALYGGNGNDTLKSGEFGDDGGGGSDTVFSPSGQETKRGEKRRRRR